MPGPRGVPASSATGSATSRRGTSVSPAAARSTCSSSRPCPHRSSTRRAASLGAGGRGAAVVTTLPADSPPAEFGPHEPGGGAPPEPELIVHDDGRLDGTLGRPDLDAALVEGRRSRRCGAAPRGRSSSVAARYFVEAFPVRPRLVVVGAVEVARSLVRLAAELGYETVVVDGRAAFATAGAVPGRRSAGRRLARRGRRGDRSRARTTRSPS